MPQDRPTVRYQSIRYAARPACEHCGRTIRHERWCIMVNPAVYYAYLIVSEPDKLSFRDELVLHSLGVKWSADEPITTSGLTKIAD